MKTTLRVGPLSAAFGRHRWLPLLLCSTALNACLAADRGGSGGLTDPQSAEGAALLAAASGGPGLGELQSYRLTTDMLASYDPANEYLLTLERRGAASLERVENAVCERWVTDIPGIVAGFESEAEVRNTILRAGMSTREFVLTQAALLFAVDVYQAKQAGRALPLGEGIPSENIALVQHNWAAVERILKRRSVR